tara:strand:+ start:794 stop:1006 length:213 start_codon:yes stop_codon:yes gene_type:complete
MIGANNVVSFNLSRFEVIDHSQASFIILNRLVCGNLIGRFFQKTKEKTGKKEKKNHLEAGRGENARLDLN